MKQKKIYLASPLGFSEAGRKFYYEELSYGRDFAEEIIPKSVSGVVSVEEMRPYVEKLVHRYGQFKEFTMSVALNHNS